MYVYDMYISQLERCPRRGGSNEPGLCPWRVLQLGKAPVYPTGSRKVGQWVELPGTEHQNVFFSNPSWSHWWLVVWWLGGSFCGERLRYLLTAQYPATPSSYPGTFEDDHPESTCLVGYI